MSKAMEKRRAARKLALQALYQWRVAGASISQIEAEFAVDNDLQQVDRDLFKAVLYGVPSSVSELDALLQPFVDRKLTDVDPVELSLIRMGAFELRSRIEVPYRVVINEAVELAKQFGGTDGHKFVNSVLDKLAPQLRQAEVAAAKSKKK
ncbi:transcription antitermination factor NusB [Hahella sp. KA22]|uniref:Transcription antitermination protein NusB n=1 Tax=Hahella chejuensis (strain KCTC 2396) TaxID=349521 RepID=NUSB_HAHCH|nr:MULTISPECIES: transcription antitermination factor NusB [Hahella]Q2S9S0.1 RecName: Full=Transcription antitermination protein NusB; AltName: Full=Antitermination factor NusB [Hahella chejuensis KCTC 2396]ABC32604.1 transcription antitermination factor NusB [Hahella chejuensis KCTC 2396]AZZ94382.1 transcription antitermination factor NusB [Hahella sp. KA22]QAY57756.1 transcription antitermination factor NusB [Hahella sp. KA22]